MRRRLTLGLALVVAVAVTSGCHRQLAKLSAAGEHEEVVRRANTARWPPRKKAARAWARSLVALGRVDEARAVLQRDFRHGGNVTSLVALADLELGQGLDGIAAAHYARIFSLETGPLHERDDVCALFRARAAAFAAEGEAIAAHVDLRRVKVLCGESELQSQRLRDSALWERVEAAARRQVRAQRALVEADPDARPDAGHDGAGASDVATAVDAALGHGTQLDPAGVASALEAELAGALGPTMLSDDELRALVGDSSWDGLVVAVDRLDPSARAYAKLRLTSIRVTGLDTEQGERQRQRWATEVMGPSAGRDVPGAWRALVVVGDLAGAELALTTSLRARLPAAAASPPDAGSEPGSKPARRSTKPEPPAPAPAPEAAQARVPRPEAWFGHVPVTGETMPNLLALARLFTARGEDARAVSLGRWVLAEAKASGLEGVEAASRTVAHAWLELGRPWSALALADAFGGSVQADVRAVAVTMVDLTRTACGEDCAEDVARREVETVVGEAWALAEMGILLETPGAPPVPDRCPPLEELLAPDAEGSLADALRATRDRADSGTLASAYARAIESDLTLTCAAEHLVPLMAARGFTVTAAKLSERLAHTPELEAVGQLETHARLALVSGDAMKARLLIHGAAGISPRPAEVWRRAAADGERYGPPDYAAEAWRQVLLLDPDAADARARRALVLAQLRALATTHHGRNTPAFSASAARALAQWLEPEPGRRWSRVEGLARTLAAEPWPDPERGEKVAALLWGDESERARHPVGDAYLRRALAEPLDAEVPTPRPTPRPTPPPTPPPTPLGFDAAALALASGQAGATVPAGAAIARPGAASGARLQAVLALPPGDGRTRGLIAVACTGVASDRARALGALTRDLERTDPSAAVAVRGVASTRPRAAGPGLRPTALLEDAAARRRVLLGADVEPIGGSR